MTSFAQCTGTRSGTCFCLAVHVSVLFVFHFLFFCFLFSVVHHER